MNRLARRRDIIIARALDRWTQDDLNVDDEWRRAAVRKVRDAVDNTYRWWISDEDWLKATMEWLHDGRRDND